jgi:hypothetical protein
VVAVPRASFTEMLLPVQIRQPGESEQMNNDSLIIEEVEEIVAPDVETFLIGAGAGTILVLLACGC